LANGADVWSSVLVQLVQQVIESQFQVTVRQLRFHRVQTLLDAHIFEPSHRTQNHAQNGQNQSQTATSSPHSIAGIVLGLVTIGRLSILEPTAIQVRFHLSASGWMTMAIRL